MITDSEKTTKRDIVSYAQSLLKGELDIPYYNLKRLFDIHDVSIGSIIFQESTKNNLMVLECSNLHHDTHSVELTISEKSWIDYLPAIYHDNDELKNFLYGMQVSMFTQQTVVNHIEDIFIPTKSDFLDWLASWYGVGFSSSLKDDTKRALIYKLIELYKKRGTKAYLEEIVESLTGEQIEIKERTIPEYLIKNDTFMKEEYNLKITFTVKIINSSSKSEDEKKLLIKKIRNILDRERPAFTIYYIDDESMEEKSTKGIDIVSPKEPEIDHFEYEKEEDIKEEPKIKKPDNYYEDEDDFF